MNKIRLALREYLNLLERLRAFDSRRFAGVVVLTLVAALFEGSVIAAMVPLFGTLKNASNAVTVDLGLAGLPFPVVNLSLNMMVAVLVVLTFLQVVTGRFRSLMTVALLEKFNAHYRLDYFRSLAQVDWKFFVREQQSNYIHFMNGEMERVYGMFFLVLSMTQSFLVIGVYVLISLLISPSAFLLSLALGLVYFYFLLSVRKQVSAWSEKIMDNRIALHSLSDSFVHGFKVIRAYNAELSFAKRFSGTLDRSTFASYRMAHYNTISTAAIQFGNVVIVCAVIYIGLYLLSVKVESIIAILLAFMRLNPRLSEIQNFANQFITIMPAVAAVRDSKILLDAHAAPHSASSGARFNLKDRLELDDITFSYDGHRKIFENFSLTIEAGKITALIGASGSGKSTIADLILGMIEPDRGRILIDGQELRSNDLSVWRGEIGYVPQDGYLFSGTLRENVLFGNEEAGISEGVLNEVLTFTRCDTFIAHLPEGLDTQVGDRGYQLSGGERQRIAIARALLKLPQLLILDEATSALDADNQKFIVDLAKSLKDRMTVITISHRAEMYDFADVVYDFNKLALRRGHPVTPA